MDNVRKTKNIFSCYTSFASFFSLPSANLFAKVFLRALSYLSTPTHSSSKNREKGGEEREPIPLKQLPPVDEGKELEFKFEKCQ